jgi:hypothetical protein
VDWHKFGDAIEEQQENIRKEDDIKTRVALFNGALISCATQHVDKVKRPKRPKPWMNPKVRAVVRKRNRLWRERGPDKKGWREDWLAACRDWLPRARAIKLVSGEEVDEEGVKKMINFGDTDGETVGSEVVLFKKDLVNLAAAI